jgi:beta-glucosidase
VSDVDASIRRDIDVGDQPWLDTDRDADERARLLVHALTFDEKIGLVSAPMAVPPVGEPPPPGVIGSAAATPGIARVGLATIQESDASLGISNPNDVRPHDTSTALPCSLLLGATFDPELARAGGAVVGAESAALGFAIQLAGGANLIREPRCGRNFEYVSEDPLLTGMIAGAAIDGVQGQGVVSTLKHFAVNAQETGRVIVSSDIGEAQLRESDLLAFEIALEHGRPRAVMTAYNRVNGEQASEHELLLSRVLKGDWGYSGFVMSDWGGTHSTRKAALAGLDRQSGTQLDAEHYFGEPLAEAVRRGEVPMARLDDMVHRLLRALIEVGFLDRTGTPTVDLDAHQRVAQTTAEQGIVLLVNDGTLPLHSPAAVAVIGGHADVGVLSGGGSSQVAPAGSVREEGRTIADVFQIPRTYHPSSPLTALRSALPDAAVSYLDGSDVPAAAGVAADADVAVVFLEQWTAEGHDVPDLGLPGRQDELVSAVAAANPRTVVVVESGGPVLMPWLDDVAALVAAWYPGSRGGEAIAAVLTGAVCPSGRLPLTFPAGVDQLPRPTLHDPDTTASNPGTPRHGPFSVSYDIEGSDVGYRWYEREGLTPLFPFGFGLSYTTFTYSPGDVVVSTEEPGGPAITVSVDVTNAGDRAGIDTVQAYVRRPGQPHARLAGFARVPLEPGQTSRVDVALEARVFAGYDVALPCWRWEHGTYTVALVMDGYSPAWRGYVELPESTSTP